MRNDRATAFAPSTVANVAVGFDILGFAIEAAGDTVTLERIPGREVDIAEITGCADSLPRDPARNTATAGLIELISELAPGHGFRVWIRKGVPVSSGMGGSAASAVAAVVAANALLEKPLSRDEQLRFALAGEKVASGSEHGDNLAPCLLGGLVLCRSLHPVDLVEVPVPSELHCALVHPHVKVDTRTARQLLGSQLALSLHVHQSANLAGLIAGCYRSDYELIRRSLYDIVIEPQRSHLIPSFEAIKRAALDVGALGCSIAGSGPSVFAWTRGREVADQAAAAMQAAARAGGVEADAWAAPLSGRGARLVE